LGCKNGSKQNQSTISVFGVGTVLVQPDVIQMSITLSNVAQTTKIAQETVSRMVRQALTILKEEGIEDKNISTASLTFESEYEYTNRRILVGQKAEQRLTFSIDNINTDSEAEKVSKIIDQLIQINGIELSQINFGVKNNTEHFIRSRELAFQKAVEKAHQYAELSNLKIKKVLSITDERNQQILPINNRFTNQLAVAEAGHFAGSTIVPTGELEITTNILVVFEAVPKLKFWNKPVVLE
jgi:uncharacterized protein YggE